MPKLTYRVHIILALALVAGCASIKQKSERRTFAPVALEYPHTKTVDQTDDYHGVQVTDPYRWLEDADAPDTRAWIEAQNKLTFAYLESIPARKNIEKRLTRLWDYEKYGIPSKKGGRYVFSKNDGLQNQSVLYTMRSLDEKPRVLLDPNKFSEDGTVALSGYSISEDGRYLAYGTSASGSDWQNWQVRDIDNDRELSDRIEWVKFSGASWTHDNKGFFYSRYDQPKADAALQDTNYFQKLYYHRLGAPQPEDTLIYERPDHKDWGFAGSVTDDGHYLIITVWQGTERKNRVFYKELNGTASTVVELLNEADAEYSFLDNDGPVFWFKTDLDAPRGRVIAIDTRSPERSNWREIIPQAAETLRGVGLVDDTFIASYLKDAYTHVRMFDLEGRPARDVRFPGLGTAYGFGGRRNETETFYMFTSFTDPGTIYHYDMTSGKSEIFRRPDVDLDPDDYRTEQVFFHSKDGTRVPMFITHKKGLKRDGRNPTLLYGYGGFNAALTPRFSVTNLVWMEMGGVYAQANIRGGGEYGREWHEAGMKLNKQNCFDDFVAAAEWLIDNRYTNHDRLAIEGASNGGLLVGACMTQRPDLFAACLPAVGVMDMLRFNKFTIGWAWVSDYGSADNVEEFRALYAYSPYHNLEPGTRYPATLITTADHDDRVVPAHSFKFAAALQDAHAGPEPVLIRIETKAGHGAGKPTTKRIEEETDQLAFLVRALDMDV